MEQKHTIKKCKSLNITCAAFFNFLDTYYRRTTYESQNMLQFMCKFDVILTVHRR